ncbi:MAG: PilZ domain-containing protein [Thermodesulfobacteriota bacterium]
MLNTKCPKCRNTITSPFLSEFEVVRCTGCGASFPVKDVLISAGPYSIYRDVLIKNIHKYIGLLKEAKSEIGELEKGGNNSAAHSESVKTVRLFISRLKELLNGCRDKLRVPGDKSSVECSIHGNTCTGALINISLTGICIDISENLHMIAPGVIIKLTIMDESFSGPLHLHGEVVWNTDKGQTGLIFTGLTKSVKKDLWSFITSKSPLKDLEENNLAEG